MIFQATEAIMMVVATMLLTTLTLLATSAGMATTIAIVKETTMMIEVQIKMATLLCPTLTLIISRKDADQPD